MSSYFGYKRKRWNEHEKLEYSIIKRAKKEIALASPDEDFHLICEAVEKIQLVRSHRYLNPLGEKLPKSTDWYTLVAPNYNDRR